MKHAMVWMLGCMVAVAFLAPTDGRAETRIGVGANYWRTLDDIDLDEFDEDGLSWLVTAQFGLGDFLTLETGVEMFQKGFAGSPDDVFVPQAYLLLGGGLYGGVGIGIAYSDGDWADDPIYSFRAGVNLELLPSIFLDIHANYRFLDWNSLDEDDIDTDTITLGAAVRIAF